MVGLGETRDEILQVMRDLRAVDCDFLTIGQYLRPSTDQIEVREFIRPEVFEEYRQLGEDMGFRYVASSPFVRSSFHAEEALKFVAEAQRIKFILFRDPQSEICNGIWSRQFLYPELTS